MAEASPAKRGRPLQGTAPKTAALPCRTTTHLRMRVENAARMNRRSIAQEVEARLYFSFDAEDDQRLRAVAEAAIKIVQKGAKDGDR